MTIFTPAFLRGASERAIKAIAQSLLAVLSVGGLGILDVDWRGALSVALLAGLASLLTSVTTADFVAASRVVAVVTPSSDTVAGPASPLPDGTPVTPGLTDAERTDLESPRDALDEGDPSRDALDGVLEQARHLDR